MTDTFTSKILESVAPWNDESGFWVAYNTALAGMFETVYGIVADAGNPDDNTYVPGWSTLLDPNNCPDDFLPFLSQFNGTDTPLGMNPTTARQLILAESGMARGTVAAIKSAVTRNLTGSQSVQVIERTGGSPAAYWFTVVVRPEEVLSVTALQAAVDAVRPGGVQWVLVQSDSYVWSQATNIWNNDTMTWNQTANQQP